MMIISIVNNTIYNEIIKAKIIWKEVIINNNLI
jgi:hypothetical protein